MNKLGWGREGEGGKGGGGGPGQVLYAALTVTTRYIHNVDCSIQHFIELWSVGLRILCVTQYNVCFNF